MSLVVFFFPFKNVWVFFSTSGLYLTVIWQIICTNIICFSSRKVKRLQDVALYCFALPGSAINSTIKHAGVFQAFASDKWQIKILAVFNIKSGNWRRHYTFGQLDMKSLIVVVPASLGVVPFRVINQSTLCTILVWITLYPYCSYFLFLLSQHKPICGNIKQRQGKFKMRNMAKWN